MPGGQSVTCTTPEADKAEGHNEEEEEEEEDRVQELCESRGGRPGLSVLTSLTVSVDVKQH